ncbi:MAG: amino acid permease, partial [Anaerolineales bacterium]|nr:amino acid permease [Anaerolineales bacterium]
MSEKNNTQHIRFSYGISLIRAITMSLSVMLVLSLLVLMGELLPNAGTVVPLISFLMIFFIGINLLGYLELSQSQPRGGAYQMVQAYEEGNWLAFITGWVLLLAGLSAAGLLIQAFASQGAALAAASFGFSIPEFPIAAALLLLTAGIKLLPGRKKRQRYILTGLLVVILVSCLISLPKIELKNLVPLDGDWRTAFTLLLISFIGLEIGAGLQGDLDNRSTNGPKVLILAVILAGLITSIVSLIILGKNSTNQIPSLMNPIADLAGFLMGRWVQGGLTILSLLAIPLALDRILSLLIRQGYAMARDGFWPEVFKKIDPRTKRPVFLLLSFVVLISFTQLVNPGTLARMGSLFYLVVLIAVNFSLSRQEQISSSFQLPIHPWIPALVMVFDLLLCLAWAEFLPAAGIFLGIGFAFYLVYGKHHNIKAKEGITVFKTPLEEEKTKQYKRILVPISNPDTAESLLHLAGSLVKLEGGKVIALRVITVPNQLPLSEGSIEAEANRMLLDQAIDQATKEEFRVQTMTRVSRSIAEGILDTAREEDVDHILVGWAGGETRTITRSLG